MSSLTPQDMETFRVRVAGGFTLRVPPDAITADRTADAAIGNLYSQLGPYLAAGQAFDGMPGHISLPSRMFARSELLIFITDVLRLFAAHTKAMRARLDALTIPVSVTAGRKRLSGGGDEDALAWVKLSFQSMVAINDMCAPFFDEVGVGVPMLPLESVASGRTMLRTLEEQLEVIIEAIPT
jgi:hypothetical protein